MEQAHLGRMLQGKLSRKEGGASLNTEPLGAFLRKKSLQSVSHSIVLQ